MATAPAANANAPVKEVNYMGLPLCDANGSLQKRVCPVCNEGMLPLGRYRGTWLLMNTDHCTHCAQQFLYLDIPDNTIADVRELTMGADPVRS